MKNSNLLVGLDIGTTSIKAVVADSGKVIGAVATPNTGMRHGQVIDIDQTAIAVSRALKSVAEKTNAKIYSVVAGIPVGMLQLETATGFFNVGEQGREVSDYDVKKVIQSAIHSVAKDNREAITFLPSSFLIDGKTKVDDPRKMIARSLGVSGILLTAPTGPLHNIKKVIERAGYYNNFFVPTPLAISSVALNESERTFGSIIVDLGGGVSTATVIKGSQIKYANIDLEGGSDITSDISTVLSISKRDAEQIKLDYGYADSSFASKNGKFAINSIGTNRQRMIDEVYLSEIINARLEQILTRLGKGLAKHHYLRQPGGIVITGGTSLLEGIDSLTANGLNVKARNYQPDQIGMRNPIYTVAYGIVNYSYEMSEIDYLVNGVIYGFGENVDEEPKSESKSSKIFKSTASTSESEDKEAYNKNKMSNKSTASISKKDSDEDKPNILKSFFKKFFD
ncbi:cell division protein FtsA [Lactobacillus ultunensis]|uniref:cell division protein FtsA n=1 Tax=Lactobacillus ultunensis TaxID=227945 RepID=UPI0002F5F2A1|nr:cell division protein FtsA [Lactobacillus ultunensis]